MEPNAPLLAVTPGEPAGIGPEIAIRAHLQHPEFRLLCVADPRLLRTTAASLSLEVRIDEWSVGDSVEPGRLACCPVALAQPCEPGVLNPANAGYVIECLRRATQLVTGGQAAALVTGPVHKGIINEAGIAFSGHTEYLAGQAGTERVVMLLAAGELRVALATTHLPLREVPDAITRASLRSTLRIVHRDLRDRFGFASPRIQVLGLNPHAGEGGHLGREEREVIAPAVEAAVSEGISAFGPVPADSAFTPSSLQRCDVVLAMFHDQGLPVLKHAGFGEAVNVTLGLPFIRTSVDHGTALDLAGQGVAHTTSLYQALRLAQRLCRRSDP